MAYTFWDFHCDNVYNFQAYLIEIYVHKGHLLFGAQCSTYAVPG